MTPVVAVVVTLVRLLVTFAESGLFAEVVLRSGLAEVSGAAAATGNETFANPVGESAYG